MAIYQSCRETAKWKRWRQLHDKNRLIDHQHAGGPRRAVNQQIGRVSLIYDTNSGHKRLREWHLHSVGEFLRPLRLLGEHRMWRLSDGDAAQRFTDRVAQLFGWRLLWGGDGRKKQSIIALSTVAAVLVASGNGFKLLHEVIHITGSTVRLLRWAASKAGLCAAVIQTASQL